MSNLEIIMYTVKRVLISYSSEGHTYIVQFIVQSTDVDINCTDNNGGTPLHEACR